MLSKKLSCKKKFRVYDDRIKLVAEQNGLVLSGEFMIIFFQIILKVPIEYRTF